jgi:hypothetical protein
MFFNALNIMFFYEHRISRTKVRGVVMGIMGMHHASHFKLIPRFAASVWVWECPVVALEQAASAPPLRLSLRPRKQLAKESDRCMRSCHPRRKRRSRRRKLRRGSEGKRRSRRRKLRRGLKGKMIMLIMILTRRLKGKRGFNKRIQLVERISTRRSKGKGN